MPDEAAPNGGVRLSPLDRRGRPISDSVLSAGEQIAWRAIRHAEKLNIDPATAASLLEEAAAAVSRVMRPERMGEGWIVDIGAYLFRAFLRRLNRRHKRSMISAAALEMYARETRNPFDPHESLERKIAIDELLMQCDPAVRDMLCRRIEGFSWKEIGRLHRMSAHAAEAKFGRTIKKLRKKLGSN